jgi:LSD1 subclass zinc finger protein
VSVAWGRQGGDGAPPPPPEVAPKEDASFIRTFPCTGCGAKLVFAPGTTSLKCDHCGTVNEFHENDARIEELDFETYLHALEGKQETHEQQHVKCEKCGAEQNLPENVFASECAFCGAPLVSKGYASRLIKPKSIVPFQVDRRRAQDAFRAWVRGLWLAPGELKRYAQSDAAMQGTYLPFWTYDCRTSSDYEGQRGEYYYENERVVTRNAQGQEVVEMRRVQKTAWTPAEGHVDRFHDDILVPGSDTLAPSLRGATMQWDLEKLVPYQPEYVSGYRAEAYRIGLRDGFPKAKEAIDANVYAAVCRDIGGDTQRVTTISTQYSDIKFKHVLLPVWMSAYRFRNKTYRFLVNGQTGEVAGESPLSWQRVTFLVIGILVVVVIALVLSSRH